MKDIYTHNWYNRNNQTWVYGPYISPKTTFSNFLYSAAEVSKFLSNYDVLAKEIQTLIKNRFGITVNIKISNTSEDSYTDGKNIVISDKIICSNNYEHLDLLFAIAFHEVAHCLYTKFEECKKRNMHCNPLLSHIQNILEDEEIENRMAKKCIGYGKYFGKLKANVLENNGAGKDAVSEKKINRLDEIMTILFCLVRYPKYLNCIGEETLNKYEDLFIKIDNILINSNCPSAIPFVACEMFDDAFYDNQNITEATVKATFEIYKYLQEYIAEDFADEKKQVEEDENSFMNKMNNGMPVASNEADPEKVDENIKNEMEHSYIPHDDIWMGSENPDTILNTTSERVRFGNPTKYNAMFNNMRKYIKTVEKLIIPNSAKMQDALEIHRFRRNGNLDTNRLAEAMQNINTIYNQRMTIKKPVKNTDSKYAFVMIIDESGSMDCYDHRDNFAFSTAILFYEVLSKFAGIELYVYGHGDRINPYITKELKDKYVLANFDKQAGQDDAQSYQWIVNDVKRQTNLPIIALSITDFYYCSSDNNMRELFQKLKTDNVAFNLLKLGGKSTPRDIAMCKRVLDGQVISIDNILNEDKVLIGLTEICDIIKSNYNKFCKK